MKLNMTKEEFDKEIEAGYKNFVEGKVQPVDKAFEEIFKRFDL